MENKDSSHFQLLLPQDNNIYHQGVYDVIIKGEKFNNNEIINIELKTHQDKELLESDSNKNLLDNINKMIKENDFSSKNIENNLGKVKENNKYNKKVTINENNNKNIIFNENIYDDTEDKFDYKGTEIEEIHPYKQNNDFYFPWYEQACECAENLNLIRYT